MTDIEIINKRTTGDRPNGYTCLHLCCDGSDRNFERDVLCEMLVGKRADIESRCAKGNTPLQLAAGAGLVSHVQFLLRSWADPATVSDRGCGCLQRAIQSSGSTALVLQDANAPETWVPSKRQYRYKNPQRMLRNALAACDNRVSGKDGKGGKGGKCGKGGKGGNWIAAKRRRSDLL